MSDLNTNPRNRPTGGYDNHNDRGDSSRMIPWVVGIAAAVILAIVLFFALGGDADVDAEPGSVDVDVDAPAVDADVDAPDVDVEAPDVDVDPGSIDIDDADAEADANG